MHNSYYLLRRLSYRLADMLTGALVHSCYSQEKDELVIHFTVKNQNIFLHVIMVSDFCMIRVPANLSRARKNSVDLFPEIINTVVKDVLCYENERCLCIEFDSNWSLLIKMFGNQSNVVLCKDGNACALFKKKLIADFNLTAATLNRKFEPNRNRLEALQGDFQKMLPTLGGEVKKHIEKRDYHELSMNEKWSRVQQVIHSLENPEYFIYLKEDIPVFTLFEPATCIYHGSDVVEALNEFFGRFVRTRQLVNERRVLLRLLERKKKKVQAGILKCQNRLMQLEQAIGHREVADIIMANMHLIPPGANSVELPDFKNGTPVTIKLKPALTPQKNAEQYYRKSKNQRKEIEVLRLNLKNNKLELTTVNEHLVFLEQCQDPKQLKNYARDHKLKPGSKSTDVGPMFKEFEFQGFVILIGKNALNNDLLTQKFAHKEDLWLHAKDVKGSHVVIKHQAGKPFPMTTIEKAAQLAAFYSKRKNDTLCPVIYTTKKFVRKPKGAAPGQVVVEREKVLLVVPESGSLRNSNF